MLDGRIDTQGTVKELRAQGILDEITHDANAVAQKEEVVAEAETLAVEGEAEDSKKPDDGVKKPKKLIKDEHREVGGVKWGIYKRYLQASYVHHFQAETRDLIFILPDPILFGYS